MGISLEIPFQNFLAGSILTTFYFLSSESSSLFTGSLNYLLPKLPSVGKLIDPI